WTGNLDRPGGARFPRAAAGAPNTRGTPGRGKGARLGRWKSRVRGLPEVFGELPVACLGEEIDTPGEGQVRALVTIAGNPVLSTPNAGRLRRALEELELMVSVDIGALDGLVVASLVGRELQDPGSALAGRTPEELLAALERRRGPERVLDWMLRSGPYGDQFGAEPGGLTLERLEASPHGVD